MVIRCRGRRHVHKSICTVSRPWAWSICNTSKNNVFFLRCNSFLLQQHYRYEELAASHEGLLKLLESHVKEIQNYNKENEQLRDEIKNLKLNVSQFEQSFHQMCEKYLALKKRRDLKVLPALFLKRTSEFRSFLDKQTENGTRYIKTSTRAAGEIVEWAVQGARWTFGGAFDKFWWVYESVAFTRSIIHLRSLLLLLSLILRCGGRTNCNMKIRCCNRKYCYCALNVNLLRINKKIATLH